MQPLASGVRVAARAERLPTLSRGHPRKRTDQTARGERVETGRERRRAGVGGVESKRDGERRGERRRHATEFLGGREALLAVVPREEPGAVPELAEEQELALLQLRGAKRVPSRLLAPVDAILVPPSGGGGALLALVGLGAPASPRAPLLGRGGVTDRSRILPLHRPCVRETRGESSDDATTSARSNE